MPNNVNDGGVYMSVITVSCETFFCSNVLRHRLEITSVMTVRFTSVKGQIPSLSG